jgi:hypothetical protein
MAKGSYAAPALHVVPFGAHCVQTGSGKVAQTSDMVCMEMRHEDVSNVVSSNALGG